MPTWICPYWNCSKTITNNPGNSFGLYHTTHFNIFNSSNREVLVRYEFFQDNGDAIDEVLSLIATSEVSSTDLTRTVWPRARQWIGFTLPPTERLPINPLTGEVDIRLSYEGWIRIYADGEILPAVRVETRILRGHAAFEGSTARSLERSRYVDCIRVPDNNPRSILGRALSISYSDKWVLAPWEALVDVSDDGRMRNVAETDLRICNPFETSVSVNIRLNGWNDSHDIEALIPGHRVQNIPIRIGRTTSHRIGWIEVTADAPVAVDAKAYGGRDSSDWISGWEATIPSTRKRHQSIRMFGRDILGIQRDLGI